MKLRFKRELVLPLFLKRGKSLYRFARRINVAPQTVWRAVEGKPVGVKSINAIATALNIDAMKFLANDDRKEVFQHDA